MAIQQGKPLSYTDLDEMAAEKFLKIYDNTQSASSRIHVPLYRGTPETSEFFRIDSYRDLSTGDSSLKHTFLFSVQDKQSFSEDDVYEWYDIMPEPETGELIYSIIRLSYSGSQGMWVLDISAADDYHLVPEEVFVLPSVLADNINYWTQMTD